MAMGFRPHLLAVVLAAAHLVGTAGAYYVPANVELDIAVGKNRYHAAVNTMQSPRSVVPLDLYRIQPSYPKPSPADLKRFSDANLLTPNIGQILTGEKLQGSIISFLPVQDETCVDMPSGKGESLVAVPAQETKRLSEVIQQQYRMRLTFQNLYVYTSQKYKCYQPLRARVKGGGKQPGSYKERLKKHPDATVKGLRYFRGIPLGVPVCDRANTTVFLPFNHISFTVQYNDNAQLKAQKKVYVTRFSAEVEHRPIGCKSDGSHPPRLVRAGRPAKIAYSYSVRWVKDKATTWEHRWDYYMSQTDNPTLAANNSINTIKNSLLLIACLSMIVALIIMRTLHLDFNRYNAENEEEMQEEVGWKLVHGDVFRPPNHPNRFAIFIGSGVQLLGMCVVTILLGWQGLTAPNKRGTTLSIVLVVFCVLALANGYVCGRIQMMFGCKQWRTPILSALLFPGFVFLLWGFCECLIISKSGSVGVSAWYWVLLLLQWWGITLPLVVVGASAAFKRPEIKPPIPYKGIARQIPPQHWIFSWPGAIFVPGVVPFVAVLMELNVIMSELWVGQVHIIFAYLAIIALMVAILVAETTIVYLYYQLVYEDYRWWWKSVVCASGMGAYYVLWAAYYGVKTLDLTPLSFTIYLIVSIVFTAIIVLVTGTIGFFTAWNFVTRIYNAIKIE